MLENDFLLKGRRRPRFCSKFLGLSHQEPTNRQLPPLSEMLLLILLIQHNSDLCGPNFYREFCFPHHFIHGSVFNIAYLRYNLYHGFHSFKGFNLMIFSIFPEWCTQHHNLTLEHFHHFHGKIFNKDKWRTWTAHWRFSYVALWQLHIREYDHIIRIKSQSREKMQRKFAIMSFILISWAFVNSL